jgi:hypothetical protein
VDAGPVHRPSLKNKGHCSSDLTVLSSDGKTDETLRTDSSVLPGTTSVRCHHNRKSRPLAEEKLKTSTNYGSTTATAL